MLLLKKSLEQKCMGDALRYLVILAESTSRYQITPQIKQDGTNIPSVGRRGLRSRKKFLVSCSSFILRQKYTKQIKKPMSLLTGS